MVFIVFVTSLVIIATSCFILGVYIYKKDPVSGINRLFFINSLLLNGVIILTLLTQFFHDPFIVAGIQRGYNIVLIIFLLESLWFNLVFAGKRLPAAVSVVLVLMTLVVFAIFIFYGDNLLNIVRIGSFNAYRLINVYFWFMLYTPLLALIVCLMVYYLYSFSRNAIRKKERRQAKIMMYSILIACTAGYLVLMVIPGFGLLPIPLLTPYFFALYLYGVFYAITRFNFMSFRLNDIALEVFSHIQDMVIILTPEYAVMDANRASEKLFGGTGPCDNKRILEQIKMDDDLYRKFDSLVSGVIDSFNSPVVYKGRDENIQTDSYISRVYDRFGDFAAILIVSKENPGIGQFRRHFNLTEREMEVVIHTISGKSNSEIAEKLKITKRTVETHHNNIYNKLVISNKIELFRVAGNFGLHAGGPAHLNQNRYLSEGPEI